MIGFAAILPPSVTSRHTYSTIWLCFSLFCCCKQGSHSLSMIVSKSSAMYFFLITTLCIVYRTRHTLVFSLRLPPSLIFVYYMFLKLQSMRIESLMWWSTSNRTFKKGKNRWMLSKYPPEIWKTLLFRNKKMPIIKLPPIQPKKCYSKACLKFHSVCVVVCGFRTTYPRKGCRNGVYLASLRKAIFEFKRTVCAVMEYKTPSPPLASKGREKRDGTKKSATESTIRKKEGNNT